MKHLSIILISILLLSSSGFSIDLDKCARNLKQLKSESADAIDNAETANSAKDELDSKKDELDSKKDELNSKKDELEDCLTYPDMYDLYGDNCQTLRWDYDSALSDYKSALSDYESALGDYETALRDYESALSTLKYSLSSIGFSIDSVNSACPNTNQIPSHNYSKPSANFSESEKTNPLCKIFKQYIGTLPKENLLEICKKQLPLKECKKCLKTN